MGEMRNACKISVGKPDQSVHLGVDDKIILERMLGKWNGKVWIGFIWDQWRADVNMVMDLRFP
jgi:hypothetical protein